MDAAEYKHVVLSLVFLKYISDAFDERHVQLVALESEGADPEDRDEYTGFPYLLGASGGPLGLLAGPSAPADHWLLGGRGDAGD